MVDEHWADKTATKLIREHPERKSYVCAAGITPSGIVHIGNFRDIITSEFVTRALQEKGCSGKLVFFWDDFDRLRKIPLGVPESFSQYMGMPISEVPDPYGTRNSYAEHFKADFESVMPALGIHTTFISQTKEYGKNAYYEGIKTALQKRKEIAKILAEFKTQGMTRKEIEEYYPLQVYCDRCRKDTTRIEEYDEKDLVTYSCKCGHRDTVDISKRNIGKLQWKVDWPMRWKYKEIIFEPGGSDHSTPGGSYTIAKRIAKEVFDIEPPSFQGYEFVGVSGITKMSSSTGTGIPPKDLLEIYEAEMLRWFFARTSPKNAITFSFDSELIRQYDEFDKTLTKHFEKKLTTSEERILFFAQTEKDSKWARLRPSFRQIASFGQIVQGNLTELKRIYARIGQSFDEDSLRERLEKSQNWVRKFAPEMHIEVRKAPNQTYFDKLTQEEKHNIIRLKKDLDSNWNLEDLTTFVYSIPKKPGMTDKERKDEQRNFFSHIYQLLIDKDTGPRLPTFLLALGRNRVKKLLNLDEDKKK